MKFWKLRIAVFLTVLAFIQSSCENSETASTTFSGTGVNKNGQTSTATLSQTQAIKSAEIFIQKNGYTSYPPVKSELSYELLDRYEKNDESILRGRKNTLHPKAYFISEDSSSWHIGFLSVKIDTLKFYSDQMHGDLPGRAVIVEKDGKEIRMAHKDPLFSYFKKLSY